MRYTGLWIIMMLFMLNVSAFSQESEEINQLNNKGEKTGLWKKYYENGQIFYEGQFKEGKPVGIMKRYYPGGILKAEMNFLDDGKTSFARLFYPNGELAAEGKYINSLRDSTWLFYSFYNNRLAISEEYQKGEKNGFSYKFYDDGDTSEIMSWKEGKRDGVWKQFYENGQLRLKANYSNDQRDGSFETFSYEGQPSVKGQYNKGVMDGVWEYYDEKGVLDFKVEYENGKMIPNEEIEKRQDDFSRRIEEVINSGPESEPVPDEFR